MARRFWGQGDEDWHLCHGCSVLPETVRRKVLGEDLWIVATRHIPLWMALRVVDADRLRLRG